MSRCTTSRIRERSCRRRPLAASCWLADGEDRICFDVCNLSEEGIAIRTVAPLPVGRTVSLQFFTPLAANPIAIAAEVVWSRPDPDEGQMGLRFVEKDDRTRAIFREFLRELERRPRPATR